jgi:hypothetical protein
MRRATALGLNVPKEAVKTMIERWLYAEKAFQVVKEKGLMEMKATLQMPNVTLNMRNAVPLAQPTTVPLTGEPRVVLPAALVGASTTVMEQGAVAAGGEEGEVVVLAGAAADAAREAAAWKAAKAEAARVKKLGARKEKRGEQSRDNGTMRVELWDKAGKKPKTEAQKQ